MIVATKIVTPFMFISSMLGSPDGFLKAITEPDCRAACLLPGPGGEKSEKAHKHCTNDEQGAEGWNESSGHQEDAREGQKGH
jgi:hypothetical protein